MRKALLIFMAMMSVVTSTSAHAGAVEELASSTAKQLSNNLPQKVNANMTLVKAFSMGKTMTISAMLHYDEKKLSDVYSKTGQSYETMKNKFRVVQKNSICGIDAVRKFIKIGGIVSYHFNFNDGNVYDIITVKTCS